MRALVPTLMLVSCGPPPTGSLVARLSADPALAGSFTTEDGWSLSLTHVVIGVTAVTVSGGGVSAASTLAKPKLIDLRAASHELFTNTMATPRAYDTVTLTVGRGPMAGTDVVNVPDDVLQRVGARAIYLEGVATRQSTTRRFQLALDKTFTFSGCSPAVSVTASASTTVDFVVHPQKAFEDDTGKLRFDAWALADTTPADELVVNMEAQAAMTSSLPPSQYGATTGSLLTLLERRALSFVTLGQSGSCTGSAQ